MTGSEGALADAGESFPGPLRRVVVALEAGARDRADLAEVTGLDRDVVDAALDHLTRLGRVRVERLAGGCPDLGCGACSSGRADGRAGCGAAAPAPSAGPVAITLTRRPG